MEGHSTDVEREGAAGRRSRPDRGSVNGGSRPAEAPAGEPGQSPRSVKQALLWPMRRFFDRRFREAAAHVSDEADATRTHVAALTADQHNVQLREQERMLRELKRYVVADRDAAVEATTFVGEALRDLEERVGQAQEAIEATGAVGDALRALEKQVVQARDAALAAAASGSVPAPAEVSELDAGVAALLNHAAGHTGYAAQRGLWFNWPVSLSYEAGDVQVGSVNERIVELPYALRATAGLAPGARILDVGAAESTLALSLAALGFEVVALDPRGYPLKHSNLREEQTPVQAWETGEHFDAVLCISTLEHVGAGDYGDRPLPEGQDEAALSRLRELLEPGGLLVLTAPLGEAAGYERPRLEELLAGWDVLDFTVAEQRDPTTWVSATSKGGARSVALVTARRAG
jgi:Methyltransferase domain